MTKELPMEFQSTRAAMDVEDLVNSNPTKTNCEESINVVSVDFSSKILLF